MTTVKDVDVHPSKRLTILGCGTLGSAILYGLLASSSENASLSKKRAPLNRHTPSSSQDEYENGDEDQNFQRPTHFTACVRTPRSAERLRSSLKKYPQPVPVTILTNENVRGVQSASTVLLGCQPQDLESCLGDTALLKALRGKLLISILAGVTIPQIEAILNPSSLPKSPSLTKDRHGHASAPPTIVRAMPNTASFVRASTTVITSTPHATPSSLSLVDYLFTTIGTVTHIPASQFDVCTALCGSTPAFFALSLEALLDGAVALGLNRSEAHTMAAETMKGAATLMLRGGESPEQIKEKVATPGGSTIQGVLELERKAMRATVADALIRCTAAAGGLGEKTTK